MTKEEAKAVELKVKSAIRNLDKYSDEELVHYYKCALSKKLKIEKDLFAPLIKEIEKIRHKNGVITEVCSKGVSLDKTSEELKTKSNTKTKTKGKGNKK